MFFSTLLCCWFLLEWHKKYVYSSDDMHYTIFNMDLQRLNWKIAASSYIHSPYSSRLLILNYALLNHSIWFALMLVLMVFKQRNAPSNPCHQYLRPTEYGIRVCGRSANRKGKRRVTRLVVVVVVVFAVCWLPIQVNI